MVLRLVVAVLHYMFPPTCHLQVCMFHFYIPEGICFAAFVAFSCTWLYYARFHLFFFCFVSFLYRNIKVKHHTLEDGHAGRNM
jgi:hypothetical protein